jgi:hypothetical protein
MRTNSGIQRLPKRGFKNFRRYLTGLIVHGSGPPTDNTSPFFLFYNDDTNDRLYFNQNRTPGEWTEFADAVRITPPGSVIIT